jgi:hypothetical protein
MKRALSDPSTEEPPIEISPEADAAMRDLVELFSDPAIAAHARFSCSTEGPDEIEVLCESILDDQFGYNPNSEYKNWVRRLYDLGLIPQIPSEWEVPEAPEERGAPIDFPRIDSCVFHPARFPN